MITLKEGNIIFISNESLKRSIAFLQTDAPFAALFFRLKSTKLCLGSIAANKSNLRYKLLKSVSYFQQKKKHFEEYLLNCSKQGP